MQTYGFCQTTYPAKMISPKGDTIIAITVPQMIIINRTINGYNNLKEVNLYLKKELQYTNQMYQELSKVSQQQDSIINLTKKQYEESKGYIEHLDQTIKDNKRKHNKNMIRVGVVSVSVGAIIGLLIK